MLDRQLPQNICRLQRIESFAQGVQAETLNHVRRGAQDEPAQHVGDDFKLLAFVLSAGIAGLAGSLKVLVLGFETLSDAYWTMSGLVILMTLVGGMGTLFGPLLGAALIVALEDRLGDIGTALATSTGVEWFRSLGESVTIVTGLIFIACVLAFRRGIVGEIIARVRPLRA